MKIQMTNSTIINKEIVKIHKIINKDKKTGIQLKIKINLNIMIMHHKTNHNNQLNKKVKIKSNLLHNILSDVLKIYNESKSNYYLKIFIYFADYY